MKKTVKRRSSPSLELHERMTAQETLMKEHMKAFDVLVTKVDALNASITKYKGFWGAVTLLGSAAWAAFALFKDNLVNLFTHKTP